MIRTPHIVLDYLSALGAVNEYPAIVSAVLPPEAADSVCSAIRALQERPPHTAHAKQQAEQSLRSYLDTYIGYIRGELPDSIVAQVARWDAWRNRAASALSAESSRRKEQRLIIGKKSRTWSAFTLFRRIESCGEHGLWLWDDSRRINAAVPVTCQSPACPACARMLSARAAHRAQESYSTKHFDLRWITLSAQTVAQGDLRDNLIKLQTAWKTLRHKRDSPVWSEHVRGYLWSLEITLSKGRWHPHYHILADGRYFAQHQLDAAWRLALHPRGLIGRAVIGQAYAANGKGDRREIRTAADQDAAIREVTKYTLKPLELDKVSDSAIVECLEAIHGIRRHGSGGTMKLDAREPSGFTCLDSLGRGLDRDDSDNLASDTLKQYEGTPYLLTALRRYPKIALVQQASAPEE